MYVYFGISSTDSKVKTMLHNIVQNKWFHRKVLLSSFHLNDVNTLGFHPQTQNVEPPCKAQ